MEVAGASMATMSVSVQKAQAGSDVLQKTLAKTAEAQRDLQQGRGMDRGDGRGKYVDIKV